jgi:hypothetical protein
MGVLRVGRDLFFFPGDFPPLDETSAMNQTPCPKRDDGKRAGGDRNDVEQVLGTDYHDRSFGRL